MTGGAWSASTLTWNSQPALDPSSSAYGTFVRGQSGPSTDVTSIVRNWVTTGTPNYGFAVKALTSGGLEETALQYQMFEENQVGWGAQLDVTYADAASSKSTPVSPATAPSSQVVSIVDTTTPVLNSTVATPGSGVSGPVQYWFRVSATSDTSDTSGGVVASSGWAGTPKV